MDLKKLREENKERVDKVIKLRTAQSKFHKEILAALTGPKTIPELAKELARDPKDVLWNLMALRKYNQIQEEKKSGEYVTYTKKN